MDRDRFLLAALAALAVCAASAYYLLLRAFM